MMNNREPETITISLDEHDVKSLINSVVHQQHLLTQQAQNQTQQQTQQQQQQQQQHQQNNPQQRQMQQHHLTVHQQQQIRQQQQPTISIIPHQVPIPVNTTGIPSTSALITTGSTTIPVVQAVGSSGRKRKPKLNQKLGQLSLDEYWPTVLEEVKELKQVDAKNQNLPLARIKKIMKLDENAKMIAAEAPLLFAKACEYFIQELTLRAWHHTEENKRRTLQRSDIVTAISRCDQFDFLIDIVPREEIKPTTCETVPEYSTSLGKNEININNEVKKTPTATATQGVVTSADSIQYLLQLGGAAGNSVQPITQIIHPGGTGAPNIQTVPLNQQVLSSGPPALTPINVMTPQNILINPQAQANLVNTIQQQAGSQQTQQAGQSQQVQLFQQIIGPNGEIQTVPISLPQNQLSFIRIQGPNPGNTNQQAQPQFIIQQPSGAIQVASANTSTAAQPSTSQSIFVNQNAIQQVLNKGNVNVTNFRTN